MNKAMSPYRIFEHPLWAERLVRGCRVLMYAAATAAGYGALYLTPPSLNPESAASAFWVGTALFLFGGVCMIGAAFQKWLVEWLSLYFLAGALGVYATAVIVQVLNGGLNKVALSGIMLMLFFALVIRLIDLTVYWWKNVKAATQKLEVECNDA